jgi:putative transposase
MPDEERELLRKLVKQYNLKDTTDIKNMLKDLFGNTIQEMLEAELEEDLGYSKYDYKNKNTENPVTAILKRP